MINENFIFIGLVINSIGGLSYLYLTLKGKVKPNRITWGLWALVPLIAFAAEITQGVGIQSILTFAVGFTPLLIFIASFINKKAFWEIKTLDKVCGILAIIGLILWLITRDSNTAIFFSIAADVLTAFPTVIKAYRNPETESHFAFSSGFIFGAITLLTIKNWNFATYAFPFDVLIVNGVISFLIISKIGKRKS